MTHYFLAQLHHMAQSELDEMLPPGTIDRLKTAGDPHPTIKVYSIAHEGTAEPSMVTPQGKVKLTMQYLRDAVNLIGQQLRENVTVFKNHAATNLHAGRKAIGQVVGKTTKEIKGVLHTLAAIHIFPPHRDEDLDIASYEAVAKFGIDSKNNAKLLDLEPITGIALGSTKEGKASAFPGATLQGAFQHFAGTTTIIPQGEGKTMTATTLSEVRDAISTGKYSPEDVFGKDALLADKTVSETIEAQRKNQHDQYGANRRLMKDADDRIDALKTELAEKDKQIAKVNASALKQKVGKAFEKIADDRKLDERQVKFCTPELDKFTSEAQDEANLLKDLNEYTEQMLKDYEVKAEIFGVKKEDTTSKAGAPPDNTATVGDGSDLRLKENNPFIPDGKE